MDIIERLTAAAKARRGTLVLPEGNDPRIVEAARRIEDDGIAQVVVLDAAKLADDPRAEAYAEAGADAIFVMALTKEDLNYFAREIKAPLVGIFATAEPLPISDFQEAGCQITIGSLVGIYAAARGLVDALTRLKETEDWNAITNLMVDDREFFEILDLN